MGWFTFTSEEIVFFWGGAWYLRLALIIIHYIYISMWDGFYLQRSKWSYGWWMLMIGFAPFLGRMKIHKIPRISMSGVRRVLTDEFHGCVWKSGSSCHEETGRETGDQTVGSCRKHANTDLLGCSTLGQSSCIPLRTFRHRGSYKCTVVTAPTMIAQQKCGMMWQIHGYNLSFCMIVNKRCQCLANHWACAFTLCVVWGSKDMITSPKWIHRCVFPRCCFCDMILPSDFQIEFQINVQMFGDFCLPLYPYGGVLKHYKPSILGHPHFCRNPHVIRCPVCVGAILKVQLLKAPVALCVEAMPATVHLLKDGSGRETETGRPGFQVNHLDG